jgi:glycosyltransferase involved in cell wall biosynthesis
VKPGPQSRALRVLHVGFQRDRLRRSPEELLGVWPTLTHTAEAARTAGIEVIVLQAAHREAVLVHNGVTCHFVTRWSDLVGRASSSVPDVVQVRGLSFPVQTRRLSKALQDPPVVVQHHADKMPAWWRRPLHAWGLRAPSGVMCYAPDQVQSFINARILPPDIRLFELPPASSRFEPGNWRDARRTTGVYGDPCLMWVGRLGENKDPLTVLDAVSRASLALPDLHLWCCYARSPLLDAVKQRIRDDPRLAGRVHLLGSVPHAEVEHLLRAADFSVLGSHRESCGFAVLEGLACGATPLVTDIPAFRNMTSKGTVGGLFAPGDSAALARLITSFSSRNRIELRQRARAHFEDHLSFHALGTKLRSVYESFSA